MEECIYCHKRVPETYPIFKDASVCASCYMKHHRHGSESAGRAIEGVDPRVQSAREDVANACSKHGITGTAFDSDTFEPLCDKCVSDNHNKSLPLTVACQKLVKLLRVHRDKALKLLSKYEKETDNILERKADACEHLLKVVSMVKEAVDKFYNDQLTTINELCDQALKETKDCQEAIKYTILQCEDLRQVLLRKRQPAIMQAAAQLLDFQIPPSLSTFNIFTQDNVQQLVELIPEVFVADLIKIDVPLSSNVLFHLSPVEPAVFSFDLATECFSKLPACGIEEWPKGAKHVIVSEGVMLIAGGTESGRVQTTSYIFNFSDQTAIPAANMLQTHEDFALICHLTFAYAIDGTDNEKYDLEKNEWSAVASVETKVSPWAVKWVDKIYCTSKQSQRLFIYTPKTNTWMGMDLSIPDLAPIYATFLNSEALLVLGQKCRSFVINDGPNSKKRDTNLNLEVLVDTPLVYQGSLYLMSMNRDGLCYVSVLNLKTLKLSVFS